ncbi:nitrate reductase molybdenum cofactor assembly chaperone [Spirillospora sp. NPDC050679]
MTGMIGMSVRPGGSGGAVRGVAWRAAALLLVFPDQRFYDRRPMLRAAVADLPDGPVRRPLTGFLDHVDRTRPIGLAVRYAEVVRGRGLHLTYYGGACRREVLDELYRAAGCDPGGDAGMEPDALPVMLEHAAHCADDWLLQAHRVPIERLENALRARRTPYAALVGAVLATLETTRTGGASGDVPPVPCAVPVSGEGQATFSDDDEEEDLEAESPEPLLDDDSDLAGADGESDEPFPLEDGFDDDPLDEAPTVEDDLPEPRLSVR